MNYNELNSHPRDGHLEFDPKSHTYHLGAQQLKSVTTLVEECFPQFDAIYWAHRKAPQEGVSPEELMARWERDAQRARDLGTIMHDKIEHYYLGDDVGDDTDAYRLFRCFASNNRLYPYRTEWRIYYEEYGVAGTLDFLERTLDGTFNIWDWKRSRKLINRNGMIETISPFRKTAHHPISHIPDCSYYHYALQVSVYRYILEQKYGITINKMRLGVFHPSYSGYYIVDLPYLRNEVVEILEKIKSRSWTSS
ncbi:MAG: PD-(D/E)XK nuclease-like domain-containing protein [Muribaculum sp.]|nr:PD-(D/E)XK nuclease-like domain-containing protein [Muribaculum sp.]